MNWYKQIISQYEDEDDWAEDNSPIENSNYADQAWQLAYEADINVLSSKDLEDVYVEDGEVLGALFTDWYHETFSFDIVVSPEHQGKGIGKKLVDSAISTFHFSSDGFENPKITTYVVNPVMKSMLSNRGFKVTNDFGDTWMMGL